MFVSAGAGILVARVDVVARPSGVVNADHTRALLLGS